MLILKADPWRPDYGAGTEMSFEDDDRSRVVDPEVETADWDDPVGAVPVGSEPVSFVDGVMRIDLRVLASDGDRRAWGVLGSYAAGAVRCDAKATFAADDRPVGRALIVGSRLAAAPLEVVAGRTTLTYRPHETALDTPEALRRKLQRLMLSSEAELAARLAGDGEIVFVDGPLHVGGGAGPVVGVVKRMVASYLDDDRARLLPVLEPGQRTPLFAIGGALVERFSWYQRLLPQDPSWHELAGLVRCEVRMEAGLALARSLADRTAALLPRFAGRPGIDPRAPQNLTPVGALEAHLRRRLGNPLVIGRALQAKLAEVPAGV